MENVIKTGYLKKGRQSNRYSLFRREPRRWYVFLVRDGNQPFLEYYDDEESSILSPPINSFNLSGCKQITYVLANRNPSFTFCIVLEDRTIELTAFTRTDLIDWCDRLETSLHHYGFLEQIRGPDDEHVYTEAPFLMRKKKPPSGSADGVHSTFNDLASVNSDNRDNYDPVPGMVLVPHYNRTRRPSTIAASPAEILSFQSEPDEEAPRRRKSIELESAIFLNRAIKLDNSPFEQVSQQPRGTGHEETVTSDQGEIKKNVDRGSIVVVEKDNSSLKRSSSKKSQQSPTQETRNLIQKDIELTNYIQSDESNVKLPNKIHQEFSSSDESDAGEYETLVELPDPPLAKKKDIHENEPVFNGDEENLKAFTEKMVVYQNSESVNHKSPILKSLTTVSPKSPNCLFNFDEEILSTEVSGDKSMLKRSSKQGKMQSEMRDDFQKHRTLSECLPDDENVHQNVRDLLKFFEDGSGSYSAGSESAETYYGFYGSLAHGDVSKKLSDSNSVFSGGSLSPSSLNAVSHIGRSPTKLPDTNLSSEPCVSQSVAMPQCSSKEDSLAIKDKQNILLPSSSKMTDNLSSSKSSVIGSSLPIPPVPDRSASLPPSPPVPNRTASLPPVPDRTASLPPAPDRNASIPPVPGRTSERPSEVNNNTSKTNSLNLNLARRSSASFSASSKMTDNLSISKSSVIGSSLPPVPDRNASVSPVPDKTSERQSEVNNNTCTSKTNTLDLNRAEGSSASFSASSKMKDNLSTGLSVDRKPSIIGSSLPPVPTIPPVPDRTPMRQSEVNNNASKTKTLDLNLEQGSSASAFLPGESGNNTDLSESPLDASTGKLEADVSPDLGYMSDKTFRGSLEKEIPEPAQNIYRQLPLPLPLPLYIKVDKKAQATGKGAESTDSLQFPPPLPARITTVDRRRPKTVRSPSHSQEEGEDGIPGPPPRRSLSVMQQVSSTSAAQSVVPLKLTQAELLRQKVGSPMATAVELRRRDCLGTIAFVNAFGCVWIVGWNLQARPKLHSHFHLGDRLISINNEPISSADAAQKFIKQCSTENVVLEVKRAPKAKVIAITRSIPGQGLGLKRDGGTAEIIYVDPNGLSAVHGLPGRSPTIDNTGTCSWIMTEINSRPLNLFLKKNEIEPMLNAVGMNISFVVQPSDFINELKKQLKKMRGYKDFLLS